jgi:hypothetical protein
MLCQGDLTHSEWGEKFYLQDFARMYGNAMRWNHGNASDSGYQW